MIRDEEHFKKDMKVREQQHENRIRNMVDASTRSENRLKIEMIDQIKKQKDQHEKYIEDMKCVHNMRSLSLKLEMNELIKQQEEHIQKIENAHVTSQFLLELERNALQNRLEEYRSLNSSLITELATERSMYNLREREIRALHTSMCYTLFNYIIS